MQARPEAVEHLEEPVGLLVVAVKAPSLAEALERIEVFAVADGVALTLLNGLEHPEIVRRRLGPRVAPGSISRFQAYAIAPGRIVQETAVPLVTAASDDLPNDVLDRALAPLRDGLVDVAIAERRARGAVGEGGPAGSARRGDGRLGADGRAGSAPIRPGAHGWRRRSARPSRWPSRTVSP